MENAQLDSSTNIKKQDSELKSNNGVKKEDLELNLDKNVKKEDLTSILKSKLEKETSLSKEQIDSVVSSVSAKISEFQKDMEKQKAENMIKNDLKDLSQKVENKQNVDISLRDNEGTVIGAMNYNKITNNVTIIINQPKVEAPKAEAPKVEAPKVEAPKVEAPKAEAPKAEAPKAEAPKQEHLVQNNTSIDNTLDVHTLVGFLSMVDKLLQEIEDTKKGISKKGLSKAGKKTMDEAKKKLEQYEKQLKGKRDGLRKQNRSEIYDSDIAHLKGLFENVNKVREDIGLGQWGEFSSTAGFLYNSPENAKAANKRQIDSLEFKQKLQEEVKKGAILNIFNGNMQNATDFYRRIAQGEYTQADYEFFRTNVNILTPSFQNCGITLPVWPRYVQRGLKPEEYTLGAHRGSVDYSNMDWTESFQEGGIPGILDKCLSSCTKMTPGQRNTWKNIGVLGCIGGLIYGGYKFLTSKNLNGREKAGIGALAFFLPNAVAGESLFDLIGKLFKGGRKKGDIESRFGGEVFGNAIDGVGNSGIDASQTIVPSMYAMMIFGPNATVSDIRKLTQRFKANRNEWVTFRQEVINNLKSRNYGNACIERFSATFSDDFDEKKWNELLASVGITDSTSSRRTVYELAMNSTFNETALTKFKSDNGLKETDISTKKQELQDYIKSRKQSNQPIELSVLESHKNDWFKTDGTLSYTERDEDRQNKEKLVNQVNALSIDSQNKEQLSQAIQTFYDERTLEGKPNPNDFSLRIENGLLILRSHSGQEAEINLDKREIVGFGNGITFTTLSDLLNVADLSNKILESQKGRVAVSYPPFQYKIAGKKGRGVYFNDAESFSFNFDTMVLSSGRGGAMGKIDSLGKHPDEYAEYLTKRWMKVNNVSS